MRRFGKWTLIGFILLSCAPVAATAADDGGVRSVFAYGAGGRALALGGAFAAIADDASASAWNAAGLSQLNRSELIVSHTELYGLGFNEQYAFLAVPSWRWGSAALSFRRFGVSGIEQRDQFNVLLDDNLTRNELEFAASYAQKLSSTWSLGLTGKVRRLSYAGYSGEGFGLDLGVLGYPFESLGLDANWARRFRTGMSIRNAIEPSITLNRDDIPDPTGIRWGNSFLQPLGSGRTLTMAVDLEKTSNMDMRFHGGLELMLHPMLAIRTGYGNGLTAGTGISYRNFAFEYSYEESEFDALHRMGLRMNFGSTIQERRQATLAREEAALQKRLRLAFEEEQRQRVQELIDDARDQHALGSLDNALDILETADALQPGNASINELRIQYLVEYAGSLENDGEFVEAAMSYGDALELRGDHPEAQAGLTRCRAESDRASKRNHELRSRFASALDAFIAEDLKRARTGFTQVLELDPGDQEAAAMLARTNTLIGQRVTQYANQADQMSKAGRFDLAEKKIDEAFSFDPESPEAERARTTWIRLRTEALERAETVTPAAEDDEGVEIASSDVTVIPQQPAPMSQAEQEEMARLYRSGMEAMEAGASEEALRYWELVWAKSPLFPQVAENLKQEYLLRGMQHFSNRELEDAIQNWEEALRVDPNDDRTVNYLERARMQLARSEAIRSRNR